MAASDFNTLLSGSAAINRAGLLAALEKRGAYVVVAGDNPASLTPGNINVVVYGGVLFNYDSTDATTAHDGVSCIVTADGKRFKTDQLGNDDSRNTKVLDKDLTAPPGSPATGDRYIVAAGGTGAWSAKDKKIARYTARGWLFTTPNAFDIAYLVDETLYYHYSAGGAWTSGLPGLTIADSSISLTKLKYFPLGVSVENQTINTPPGSPSDGVAYIVGGTPTGAWMGHTLDLAIYESASSAWKFFDGYEGARVYDKALDALYTHNGATWATPAVTPEVYLGRLSFAADATKEFTGLGAYKFLRFKGYNIKPSADDVSFLVRLSSDGATYLSSNYINQQYNVVAIDTAHGLTNGTSGFYIVNPAGVSANLSIGNAAGDGGLDFTIEISSFSEAQKTKFRAMFEFGTAAASPLLAAGVAQGWHTSQTAMQAIRFLFSGGNLASGYIDAWGIP